MLDKIGRFTDPCIMNNRRSEPRFSADQSVTVTRVDCPQQQTVEGKIIDYSASGIAILVPVSFVVGNRLEIKWPRGRVLAEVRNCHRTGGLGFRVGVKLSEIVTVAGIESETDAA
jgi:PilZ domain